jgi:hypothetical protein
MENFMAGGKIIIAEDFAIVRENLTIQRNIKPKGKSRFDKADIIIRTG